MTLFKRLLKEEDGQGLVEYSLILAVIAVAIIVVGVAMRTQITGIWQKILTALTGANTAVPAE